MASSVCHSVFPEAAAPGQSAPGVVRLRSIDWLLIAQCLVLIVATCLCYWPALNGAFQWDDGLLIRDNDLVKSLGGLGDIWGSTKPYDYFPLTYTTFWLEWPLWGLDPTGYHLVNLGLHLAAAGLLWKLLLELRLPGAWLGALLFALHPVNVASVAWIAERKNTLSMVFYLSCLLCYARMESTVETRARRRRYGWALGFFALAALSKSSVVMLPFVLLLLGWWRRGKLSWTDLARSAPFVVVSLACGVVTMWFQYHRSMEPGFHAASKLPLLVRTLLAGHAAGFYLGKALWPTGLAMVYPRWPLGGASSADSLRALGWLGVVFTAWAGRSHWGRGPLAVLLYFLIMLAPVSGLLHMSFSEYSYVSDHLVELALVGIIVAISTSLALWQARGGASSWMALTAMGLVAGAYGVGAWHRADQFSSPKRLWESARVVAPQSFAVYNNLGADAEAHGQLAEAEIDYRKAIELEPRLASANERLATVLREQGKWPEAGAVYLAILRLEPSARAYNNLAVVFLELGDTRRARVQLERALALQPMLGNAYFNLFRTERAEHHLPAAAAALRACLRCNPCDAVAMTLLASLSLEQAADAMSPRSVDPLVFEPAIALADRACQLTQSRDPQCLEVLSKALLASGRQTEALTEGRKALAAALARHQEALAAECETYVASLAETH